MLMPDDTRVTQVMEAWLELARTYLAAGDVENATACHKQGFDLTPEGRAVLVMQAALHEVGLSLLLTALQEAV